MPLSNRNLIDRYKFLSKHYKSKVADMSSTCDPNAIENDDAHIERSPQKNNSNRTIIRVGSRKSELALVQTNHVISMLKKTYPNQKFEIYEMTTVGDRVLNISLPKIGEKSLFTKDLEEALENGDVDFVVHSLKDLPTALPENMTVGAVLKREDPRDALVLSKHHEGKCLKTLPAGSIIGTSSLRRIAQILRTNSHLKVHDIRGNLNTRLAKLDALDSKYAGIVLAQAGLTRLGWHKRINQTIEPSEMLYAVGQGALAVECRASDKYILEMLQTLVCHQTQCRILAERSFLKTLGGGCSAPVAVHSTLVKIDSPGVNRNKLHIIGSVWSLDGKTEKQAESECELEMNEEIDVAFERQASDEEDAVPTKRMKIANNNLPLDKSNIEQINLSGNIDNLKTDINIHQSSNEIELGRANFHSDVRTKSPSSFPISTNTPTGMGTNSSIYGGPSSKCPLNLSVGQEVMGQCPYSVENNQILFDGNVDLKNNISCPFKHGVSIPSGDISKCPVFNKPERRSDTLNENRNENLFCGIYPHSRWPIKVFEQCEQLGKNLANKLIEKGAISIMESAQNEIRNNM